MPAIPVTVRSPMDETRPDRSATASGWLRDPANGGRPLQLSLDLSVQAAVEQVLLGGMKLMNAKGASAVLMDTRTGYLYGVA